MQPIHLHPGNGHYFLFRDKPTILVTSAGHYGMVLNLDFDSKPYLDTIHKDGLNYVRIFSGAYCEDPQSFNIQHNNLAPLPNRLIAPWARSQTPGYANGGAKFDLNKWDEAYFARLKSFCKEAGKRGIVVEFSLFCPFYGDEQWRLSPMNAENNVNGIGTVKREEVYTLQDKALTDVQDAMTRKIVAELNDADNVFYEICNEPYFGGITLEWQRHVARVIVESEATLSNRHLIAQNIANGSQKIENPDPAVSLFNFHYASPPEAVTVNYELNKAIGFDESGFKGVNNLVYRLEAWEFVFAGGGLFNNLDYSFTTEHPDGTEAVHDPTPGGGGADLRAHLLILTRFIEKFDFIHMKPDYTVVKDVVPAGATARVLSNPGKAYAIHVNGGTHATLTLDLPAGRYHAEWIDTHTGAVVKKEDLMHTEGGVKAASPDYVEDTAVRIVRTGN